MTDHTEPRIQPRDRRYALFGAVIALLLAGIDQTVVSIAGPVIQRELAIDTSLYAWLTTSYLLSSVTFLPIYGKLSDLYGRKPIMLIGIVIFGGASLACGFAWNAWSIIICRALQGIGAAALFTGAYGSAADLYPPAERAAVMGTISAIYSLSSIAGPLIGGTITDTLSWHWVFFLNVPLAVLAFALVAFKMPYLKPAPKEIRIDYLGAVYLVLTVVPLLLAFSLGRSAAQPDELGYLWTSWPILSMFALFGIGLVLFLNREYRASEPIIDLRLFRNRTFSFGVGAMFVLHAAFLSSIIYLPLFLVNVFGFNTTNAGIATLPMMGALAISASLSGNAASKTGYYKTIMIAGLSALALGFLAMGWLVAPTTPFILIVLITLVIGAGLGPILSLYLVSIQNIVKPEQIGVATGTGRFSQQIGGTIGITLLGTIFATVLVSTPAILLSAEDRQLLPPTARAALQIPTNSDTVDISANLNVRQAAAEIQATFEQQRNLIAEIENDTATTELLLQDPLVPLAVQQLMAQDNPDTAQAITIIDTAEQQSLNVLTQIDTSVKSAYNSAFAALIRTSLGLVIIGLLCTFAIPGASLRRATNLEPKPAR